MSRLLRMKEAEAFLEKPGKANGWTGFRPSDLAEDALGAPGWGLMMACHETSSLCVGSACSALKKGRPSTSQMALPSPLVDIR